MAESAGMPGTMWTLIAEARQRGGPALNDLLRKYRSPILGFLRRSGSSPEQAEDLAQEILLKVVQDDILAKADPARGKFRTLLLSVARHAAADKRKEEGRLKRGGGLDQVRMAGGEGAPGLEEVLPAPETDETFDPLWVENLVRLGMDRLRRDCEGDGTPYYKALLLHVDEELGYAEIAGRLDLSEGDVKNHIRQARLKLRRHVLEEVCGYCSTTAEYEVEAAYLMKFLQ